MELYSVLITGANRGIGLEFTRQLVNCSRPPKHLFATDKDEENTQDLTAIQNSAPPGTKVHILKMDISLSSDVEKVREVIEEIVGEDGLTLLINNAGILLKSSYPEVTAENLLCQFKVNAVGPVLVAQAMLPLLKKAASKTATPGMSFSRAGILNISSVAGSITNVGIIYPADIAAPGYKMSKSALNMAMRILAAVLKEDNVLVANICPGWVKTHIGSQRAELFPRDSIKTMLETVSKLNETHHGTYMDRFGKPYAY